MLTQVDIITPNLGEAKSLANLNNKDVSQDQLAKKIYHVFGITSIIVKGGHTDDVNYSSDYCFHQLNQLSQEKQDNQDKDQVAISYQLSAKRSNSHYSHGGGCSFATGLSAFLAQGYLTVSYTHMTLPTINTV